MNGDEKETNSVLLKRIKAVEQIDALADYLLKNCNSDLYRKCWIDKDHPNGRGGAVNVAIAVIEMLKTHVRPTGFHDVEEYYREPEPPPPPKIVCLCGSTRFMDKFFEVGWDFTLKGYVVLSVGVCKHSKDHGGEALGQDVADRLDELHLRKIDLADEVYVLNVDGYIGDSTRKEIEYAKSLGKPISYLEPFYI